MKYYVNVSNAINREPISYEGIECDTLLEVLQAINHLNPNEVLDFVENDNGEEISRELIDTLYLYYTTDTKPMVVERICTEGILIMDGCPQVKLAQFDSVEALLNYVDNRREYYSITMDEHVCNMLLLMHDGSFTYELSLVTIRERMGVNL